VAKQRETYWALVLPYSQIVGKGGVVLDVGERDAQDSVMIDGVRWPVDPWDRVTVVEPEMGDAVVSLVLGLGAEVLEMTEG
jgi:hypothetical protein